MRRLRQFLIFSWPFTISYFIASIIMSVLIAVFIPGIDKYPDLNSYIHSPFGLSFLITLLSAAFVLIIVSFSISEFFQKRRRIHSSSRFRVMVDIEGKKVYLDVPNREEALMLLTRFKNLKPTIYENGRPFSQDVDEHIDTEQTREKLNK